MEKIVSVEWPRQRALQFGPGVLSDRELLTVLLQRGSRGTTCAERAENLLEEARGLVRLLDLDAATLRQMGFGGATTSTLLAAVELARRLAPATLPARKKLPPRGELAALLARRYAALEQELLGVLFLDVRGGLIVERELFRGSWRQVSVSPYPIVQQAVLLGARKLMVYHTHPGGDPTPSFKDVEFTRSLCRACDAVQIILLDHFVVGLGGGSWSSILHGRKS